MVKSKHYLNLADQKFIHRFSVFSREWFFWCLKQCHWCRLSKILVWYVQCRIQKPVVIINNSTVPYSHLGINYIIRINVAVMCKKNPAYFTKWADVTNLSSSHLSQTSRNLGAFRSSTIPLYVSQYAQKSYISNIKLFIYLKPILNFNNLLLWRDRTYLVIIKEIFEGLNLHNNLS